MYREFVKSKYGNLETVREIYGTSVTRWDDVSPPTKFSAKSREELPLHLDWAEFQERAITAAVARFAGLLESSGIKGMVTAHNLPLGDAGLPVSLPRIDREVDITGLDYYHAAREHRTIKRRSLYLSGTVEMAYAPELGVGAPPWFTPLDHEDSLYCAMTALAYGLRGFNLYMAVDRDRWYGAPIDATGTPRLEAGAWKTLLRALLDVDFHRLDRPAPVALMVPEEYQRLSRATHLLGGVASPSALEAMGGSPVDACREDDFGFKGPVQVVWWRMLAKISDALTKAQVPYVYVDSACAEERLEGYSVIVSPSFEFACPKRHKRLCRASKNGSHVVLGPTRPSLNLSMKPQLFEVPQNGREVLIDTPEDAAALVADLIETEGLRRDFQVFPSPLETSAHYRDGAARVLFVINPGRARKTARVSFGAERRLTLEDALNQERFTGTGELEFPISGHRCRMFLVTEHGEADRATGTGQTARRARARRTGS